MEVQRKLHQYDQMSRMDLKGKNYVHVKSGRYRPGAGFTKGLRLWLSQGLKSESFVFAKSWT